MNKLLLVASAAVAAFAVAPAANASVSVTCPSYSSAPGICSFSAAQGTGIFADSFSAATSFTDTFTIDTTGLTDPFRLNINANLLGALTFSSFTLAGPGIGSAALTADNSYYSFVVNPGLYTVTAIGSSTGRGSYSGNIAIAPVPEPATWAMLVAGIAAVGFGMRRRSSNVRLSFS